MSPSCCTQDWNDGRIPYYTLPPARHSDIKAESQVRPAWLVDALRLPLVDEYSPCEANMCS